jgi:outer membrane protein assembly factor BamB
VVKIDILSLSEPRAAVLVVLLVLLFADLACPVSATASMYRSVSEHTGVYDDGGSRPNGQLAWKAVVDDSNGFVQTQPAIVDGVVYFADNHRKVYAVDASNGTRKWVSAPLDSRHIPSSPAVADGYVIVCGDGVYGIDATTGQLRWTRTPVPIDDVGIRNALNPPTVWNHTVFVSDGGDVGDRVVAITTGGSIVWNKTTAEWARWPNPHLSDIAVHAGTLWFAERPNLYIVDALSGGGRGLDVGPSNFYGIGAPAYADGKIYRRVGLLGGIGCQDPQSALQVWFNPFLKNLSWAQTLTLTDVAVGGGRIYAGGGNVTNGKLWCLDQASGALLWEYSVPRTGSDNRLGLAAYANGVVYATGSNNRLYAVDAINGTSRWIWTNNASLSSPPAIADGKVFVGGWDGERGALFAIGTQAGPTPTVEPIPGGTGLPTDIDSDGKYEDVNGNGRKDFADVTLYFNRMTWIAENEPVAAFDFNGNGRIDFADVTWLFNGL